MKFKGSTKWTCFMLIRKPTNQSTQDIVRERPFNLKGGYGFFLKNYSDSQCCWKKYSDFGGGKKKCDSEFLSYNLMLNSGKKKYSNSCVVWKKNSERNKKP